MTIFALEQAVSNGCQLDITDADSALEEVAALRDEHERLKNDAAIFYEAAAGLLATNDALRAQLAETQRELIAKESERAGLELERNNAQRQHTMQCAINKSGSQRILELTAQLAEAQRDAEVNKQINRACVELPDDFRIDIEIERNSVCVYLLQEGEDIGFDDPCDGIARSISAAIDAAKGPA